MPTEIYICRPGQAIKDGRVEYSQSVTTKDEAKVDAAGRCRINPAIAKIAYYQVDDNDNFRIFYSHTNPDVRDASAKSADPAAKTAKRKKRRAKPAKKTLLQKIKVMLKGKAGPRRKGDGKPRRKKSG